MQNRTEPSGTNAVIRLGRSMQLSWGIALGVSLAISLNAFVLVGWVTSQSADRVSVAYLLSLLLFLPVVLTYAERATASRGRSSSDVYSLLRVGGSNLATFAGGWLLLLGYVSLAALLARGMGVQIDILLQAWFGTELGVRWLALIPLLLVVFSLAGVPSMGSWRIRFVYGVLGVVLIVMLWVGLDPPAAVAPGIERQPADLWTVVAYLATGLWSIGLLLGHRGQTRPPRRAWLPALFIPVLIAGLLGAATSAIQGYPHVWSDGLDNPTRLATSLVPQFVESVFVLSGLIVGFIALGGVLANSRQLVEDMVETGYLPIEGLATQRNPGRALAALATIIVATGLLALLLPAPHLVGLAGLGFLWITALLNGRDAFRLNASPSRKQAFKLPFHPLFPGLATGIGLFLPFALGLPVLLSGAVWMLLGMIYYAAYARRQSATLHEGRAAFREASAAQAPSEYTVIAAITSPYTAASLIRAGARLAKAQNGRLLALQVLALSEQLPEKMKRFEAQEQLRVVEEYLQRAGAGDDVSVVPFVRVSRGVAPGIVDTVREENADLLLLAWEDSRGQEMLDRVWDRVSVEATSSPEGEETGAQKAGEFDSLLDTVVHMVPCDVAILRGQLPQKIEAVMVPTAGTPNVSTALRLGQALTQESKGLVTALHVVTGEPAAEKDPAPLASLLAELDDASRIEERSIQAASVKSGILKESRSSDVLVMSTAKPGLLEERLWATMPVEVAQDRRRTTLLVRPSQKAYYLGLRRAWLAFSGIFSALTPAERAEISAQMREAARPSINFFVLITLAATIATLGLLQDSGAVIIGAMLVAPLMSPIASTAMGIVEGDARLMRVAVEAILKGIGMAISVSVAVTILFPEPQAINQILARTQPNLLDLVVALASGAAAGYALSRKEVTAALPGVSIAVALVPPLCVVGYGTATAQFDIAGGAFLLFTTNVIAIILAAAGVFLLLGFRPLPAQQEQFRRGLLVSMISLILIAIPLALLLNVSLSRFESQRQQADLQRQAETILSEATLSEPVRVVEVEVEYVDGGYIVLATVYDYADFGSDQVSHLEDLLSAQLDSPVTLRATILDARLTEGD